MMKNIFFSIVIFGLIASQSIAGEKKVLVEIFTNSHCGVCPIAHSALDNYLETANKDKIEFIYYHMVFPYPTDQLNLHNQSDAAAKNNFYGPFFGTPVSFFNGQNASGNYSGWKDNLDVLVLEESSFDISLSGNYTDTDFTVAASILQTSDLAFSNLSINFVVVEDVYYLGGNNIANHKNVMRKIVNPEGDSFTISFNENKTLEATIAKNSVWDLNKVRVIAFIQDKSTKEVYQSKSIAYTEFGITNVNITKNVSNSFKLEQNYPNPFNPSTTINYSIPITSSGNSTPVKLIVYDILGNEMLKLVNESKSAGDHQINFNASKLANGVYYYQLIAGDFIQTKKMILLK